MKVLVFLAMAVAVCVAAPWSGNTVIQNGMEEHFEVEEVIRSQYKKTIQSKDVDTFLHDVVEEKLKSRNLTMYGFSWSNCAQGSNLNIKTLTVSPDPISIPGSVTVSLDAVINNEVTDISSAVLVIKKKIFGVYVEIPCVDNLGSCTYNNICPMLAKIECPQQLIDLGFTCHCPFAAKEYEVPAGTEVTLPKIDLPSFIESGDYEIKATLMSGSTTLACYDVKVSLAKN